MGRDGYENYQGFLWENNNNQVLMDLDADNGNLWIRGEMRADFFRDANNTNYYVDPAGTSYVNDFRANILYDRNNTGYYVDPASTTKLNALVVNSCSGCVGSGSGNYIQNQLSSAQGANFWISGQGRVAILYDSNNTGFYADPASTSYFNDFRASIMYDRDNTAYYANPASTSYYNDFRMNIIYDRQNTNYYVDPNGTTRLWKLGFSGSHSMNNGIWLWDVGDSNHVIYSAYRMGVANNEYRSTYWDGTDKHRMHFRTHGRVGQNYQQGFLWENSSNQMLMDLDADNGNLWIRGEMRANFFRDANNTGFYVDPASTSYVNDFRASIVYDRDNTSYYANPASTSYFNDFRPNIIYDRNNTAYYVDPASTTKLNALVVNSCTGCVGSGSNNAILNQLSSAQSANFWISGQGRVALLYDSNNTAYYADPASTSYFNDFRTNILYDRQNTSYYLDPAGNNHFRYSLYLDDSSVTSHTIIGRGDQWVSGAGKGVVQYYSNYIWPGRVDGTSGGGWNRSWYLASHASYGLY
ncbi:hypothetical protein D6779_12110, partial [Candidatus Parcubacteria bacterium]